VLRSVKYGLYGAVLAALFALPTLWSSVDKSVQLIVDGQPHTVQTTAADVGQVVRGQGYRITAHDLLAPSASSPVNNGTKIVLRRGRLLHLNVDGASTDVWTTATTVEQALAQLGYSNVDFVSVSRSVRLPLGVTDIAIRTPRLITFVHDGKHEQITTTDATIGQLVSDIGLVLGPHDRLSVPLTAQVQGGETIRLQRVTSKLVNKVKSTPFSVTKRRDPSLYAGTTKILTAGQNGSVRVTYSYIYVDGKLAGHTMLRSYVLRKPTTQVEKIGTKSRPARTLVVASAPTGPPPSPGSAQAIARDLLAQRGWSDQYSCLVSMWNRESGWNVHAANPSGAYGIPQALPGSKMASAGPDWQNNATTQIKWGLGYISERYGTPCGAWSFWQSNGWY
jgi:uncharacterized protein YabE (DUF348 family)